jgi:hypothetical protein
MTAITFTESVCNKLGGKGVFASTQLVTRFALFAEILRAARTPKGEGRKDEQSTE